MHAHKEDYGLQFSLKKQQEVFLVLYLMMNNYTGGPEEA